jgi:hypothetical protein
MTFGVTFVCLRIFGECVIYVELVPISTYAAHAWKLVKMLAVPDAAGTTTFCKYQVNNGMIFTAMR